MRVFKSTVKTTFTLDELAIRKDGPVPGTGSSMQPSSASSYYRYKDEAKVEVTRVEIERGYGSLPQRTDAWDTTDIDSSVTLSLSWKDTVRENQIIKFDLELTLLGEEVNDDVEHPIVAEYMLHDVELTIAIPKLFGAVRIDGRKQNLDEVAMNADYMRPSWQHRKVIRLYFQEEIERKDFLQQIEVCRLLSNAFSISHLTHRTALRLHSSFQGTQFALYRR